MARHAVAATAARAALVGRLNAALAGGVAGAFPAARDVADLPDRRAAGGGAGAGGGGLAARALAAGRARDAAPGGAAWARTGPTWGWRMRRPALAAALASTGQQKALLVGVVLGHAALLAEARGFAPLLLLDEPAVHLDRRPPRRRCSTPCGRCRRRCS